MNQTKSKVIALLMVIPLLLILVMTSVVETIKITVDIPVDFVEIIGDKTVDIDLADHPNSYAIQTKITPESATNQKITWSAEQIEGKDLANVKISDDGVVTALSFGSVRIVATADGGKTASIQMNFNTSDASNVNALVLNVPLKVGEKVNLTGEDYMSKLGAIEQSTWQSNNENVVTTLGAGVIKGIGDGSATVTGAINGKQIDSVTGQVKDKVYDVSYNVTVTSPTADQTGIVFAASGRSDVSVPASPALGTVEVKFSCTADKLAQYGNIVAHFDPDNDGSGIQSAVVEQLDATNFVVKATLKDTAELGKSYAINLYGNGVATASHAKGAKYQSAQADLGTYITTVTVCKGYFTFAELDTPSVFAINSSRTGAIAVDNDSITSELVVEYFSDNPGVLAVDAPGGVSRVVAKSIGEANIWAKISYGGQEIESAKVAVKVVDPLISISFDLSAQKFGLENTFVIAGNNVANSAIADTTRAYNASATTAPAKYQMAWTGVKKIDKTLSASDVVWTSGNTDIATVDEQGFITVVGNGEVTITAEGRYNKELGVSNVRAAYTFVCRKDAVWVNSYSDLMFASDNQLETVLNKDIMLAPVLEDLNFSGYADYLLNVCTKQMHTTADDAYYRSNNHADDAVVRYCVNISNNLYGNGHKIDAQNITRAKHYDYTANTGNIVFDGPLDLVRIYYDNTSKDNAAVKAQDNIVFLVDRDNVAISNVELKGCSDSTLMFGQQDGEGANLSNLDYVGTVLEIVGDNCSLTYSRVNNGRTVVRVYGKAYQADESLITANPDGYRINMTIANCILSYGREFILKVGSNQVKKNPSKSGVPGDSWNPSDTPEHWDDASPYFTKADGTNYPVSGVTDSDHYVYDDYFYNNYVMTDLTVRDCVFNAAGLFSIGLESKFAGLCLHGYDFGHGFNFGSELGWGQVAGTSYPAAIRMEGDVRFYDWKKVADVNSDTLIETSSEGLIAQLGFNLDFGQLILDHDAILGNRPLTLTYEGEKYVNGAIAFYGGGKNYSYVLEDGVSSSYNPLSGFNIPISVLGDNVGILYLAAGKEDFRFKLYDSTSDLKYADQLNDIASNSAYSWLEKKK